MRQQFAVMVEFGAKSIDAIRTATTNAARLLNLSGQAGAVAPGAYADIIAVDGDPRDHVEQLEHVKLVIKEGKVYRDEFTHKTGWR